jgi:NAD+ diphosphatase
MDRATEERIDDANVDAAWADPRALVLPVREGRVPVVDGGASLRLVPPASLNGSDPLERYFLGKDEAGAPFFAVRERPSDAEPEGQWSGLREVGGLLSDRDAGLFVHSLALANWHVSHQFCARCGKPTQEIQGGHVRRCPSCRTDHFPRTDPAIIVLVTDEEDRCLLGHGANWPEGRFSTLAGFVEPGESLESAVIREVHEESGIVVTGPEYAGSQPWPFPSSLMLGFFARAVTTEIKVDGVEVTQAQWFSRDELASAFRTGTVLPPGGVSIARRLVETWFGSEITDTW